MNTTENPPTETQPPLTGMIVPPNTVREKCQARYKFTIEEIADLGTRLSRTRKDYSRIESELDSIKMDFKGKLSTVELEQDALCRKLDDGFEMREATAIVTFNDPTKGRKTYRHEETGEVIAEEPMSHADFQLPMFKDKDGKDATESPAPAATETTEGAEFSNTEGEGTKEDLGRILDDPNAGQTSIGAALDNAAVKTDQPQIVIPAFEETDWTPATLRKAFVKAARKAQWPEFAISTMSAGLRETEDLDAMKTLLRAHVVAGQQSFEQMFTAAKADYGKELQMRNHFTKILRAFPEQYPGGDSEQNLNRFLDDIEREVESDIQAARTTEGE